MRTLTFQRQYYEHPYVHERGKKRETKLPQPVQLPAFMVGGISASVSGLDRLLTDLNHATFGLATDTLTKWDFLFIRNYDQNKPTVDIYAVPRTNDRLHNGSPWGFYALSESDLEAHRETFLRAQPVIATFIEGWLQGKAAGKDF